MCCKLKTFCGLGGPRNINIRKNEVQSHLYLQLTRFVFFIRRHNNRHQFLQIDLGKISKIIRVGTQGRAAVNQWVTVYYLSSGVDGVHFARYRKNSVDKVRIKVTDRKLRKLA